jgi:hypothetical protein
MIKKNRGQMSNAENNRKLKAKQTKGKRKSARKEN